MATFSRVSPSGWAQGEESVGFSRVYPNGWNELIAAGVILGTAGTMTFNQKIQTFTNRDLVLKDGIWHAKVNPATGDRVVTLSNGTFQAGTVI